MHSIFLSWRQRSVRHDIVIQIYVGLSLGLLSLQVSLLPVAPLALPPPHVVLLSGALGRVSSVGEVVQIIPDTRLSQLDQHHGTDNILPVRRGGAVHVIIPVADPKLLVEAGLVGAHVGNPSAVLVTHVENLAIGGHSALVSPLSPL